MTAVSDTGGYYRLLNLPPGTYAVTAELAGFSSWRREGIIMRAGITFSVDVDLKVGALAETITVTGDSPMIETGRPTSVLNIDGDLVRSAPITSRRLFSDALDLAPGVGSRNVDDGVGRRAYYFRGSHIYAHAFQLEGAPASAYIDSAAHSMGMGGDTVQDVEIKLGGVDASNPMSTGVVMNVVTPRGQNQLKGSFSYSYQPLSWNGDNTKGGAAPGGLPTFQEVNQYDVSLGGKIIRDRVWFFGTYRHADLKNGISRTDQDLAYLRAFNPAFEPFDNFSVSHQPYVKVTTQAGKHELSGLWQYDRNKFSSNRERDTHQINPRGAGGSMYLVKLNSVWGDKIQTLFSASYNNKGGNAEDTYENFPGFGPSINVHQSISLSGGVPTGSGILVTMNNTETLSITPSTMSMVRGDLTYYKTGWVGSHELKTGVWGAPTLARDVLSRATNDGFNLERVVQIDPNNPAAGTRPFMRRTTSPVEILTTDAHDRDWAVYVQDMWKPFERVTLNMGVRVDWVRRYDEIFGIERMNSRNIGPRIGGAFLLTEDARNVVRAFFGRVHEQVNGRDPITTFGPTSRRFQRDIFDNNGDGIFEIEQVTPGGNRGDQRARVRSQTASAVRRRIRGRLRQAVPRPDQPRSVVQPPLLQGCLRGDRHQRHLSERSEPAVRWLWPGRSEPGHDHAADQRHLEPGGGHQRRGDPRQEPVAQLPGDGDGDAAMAAHRRHVESHRPGALHPARRVPEQSRSVASPVRQRRRQQPRWWRRRIGSRLPAVFVANRGAVLRAVGSAGRGQLRHPGRRLSRTRRGAERHR